MLGAPVKIARSRPTSFRSPPPSLEMMKIPLLFGGMALVLLALDAASTGTKLVLIGSLVALAGLAVQRLRYRTAKRNYGTTPAVVIDGTGVLFNGDVGPQRYAWSDFGEAFLSELHGRPIVQHLAVADLHRKNYDRYSSYYLTFIDYLAMEPTAFLALLVSQPHFPESPSKKAEQNA